MCLLCQNLLFKIILICLTYSSVYSQPANEGNELLIKNEENIHKNNTKSEFNQKIIKSLPKFQGHTQINEDLTKPTNSFLPSDSFLKFFNIPNTNNERAIDILKSAVKTKSNNANSKKDDRSENTYNKDFARSINTTNGFSLKSRMITGTNNFKNDVFTQANKDDSRSDEDVAKATLTQNFLHKDSVLPFLKLSYDNEESIEILKSATKSVVNNENGTKKGPVDIEKIEKSAISTTTTSPTSHSSPSSSATMTSTTIPAMSTKTEDEIILSELAGFSPNEDEEVNVGQHIELKRSISNSDTDFTNSAGAEILKNTSAFCGSQFGKRISFANETTLMEFPWTALLLYNTKMRYHCGGSLITTKYVLTAAHCVAQQFFELTGVRLGEHDVSKPVDCAPDLVGQDICSTTIDAAVVKIIIHHGFSHLSFKNDIALLRLEEEYLSRSFYPICLPTPAVKNSLNTATVAGWGATEKAIRSEVLLKAEVPILDMSKCREIYRYSVFNDSTEICGSGTNEIDVCKGDSGGAIFFNHHLNGKDKYYQLGIISLGVRRCGDKRFLPAVFTKLNGFNKWIENNLEY